MVGARAPRVLKRVQLKRYSSEEARAFIPQAKGCMLGINSDKAWQIKYLYKLGPPPKSHTVTWNDAIPCHEALAACLKWAWECHKEKTSEECPWDLDSLAASVEALRD